MPHDSKPFVARRSFLSRIGTGLGVFAGAAAAAEAQTGAPAEGGNWRPSRHPQDDWLDVVSAKHRFIFDTTTPAGIGEALAFANNFLTANQSGYGLSDADSAVVIVARHRSTPFAYNDAIWAKYSAPLGQFTNYDDPK